jgi:hypothetical protein
VTVPEPADRADVSVVVVARGDEACLVVGVRSVLTALDHAARPGAGAAHPGTTWLRGERLHGELLLLVGDVALLPADLPVDPRVRVLAASGASGGRARNLGVAAARGRYLLFTDPASRVPPTWVTVLTEPLRTGHADLVGGPVHLAEPTVRPWLTPEVAAAYLDVVPDPPGAAFSGSSAGATRAVLEAVGFDEDLGTARLPYTGDVVFRRDVVATGLRAIAVQGASVERVIPEPELTRRALAARARAHGRGAAYVDRHLRDVRPPLAATLVRLAGRVVLVCVRGRGLRAGLDAHAAAAYHRELLRLRSAPYRERPRSAAGDVPGGAGAPRAAAPAVLVPRDSVPPTALPPAVERPVVRVVVRDDARRGSVAQFWGRGRSRAADVRAADLRAAQPTTGRRAAPPAPDLREPTAS